jgi:hypothetical protein
MPTPWRDCPRWPGVAGSRSSSRRVSGSRSPRSQLAGIGAGIAFYFGETFATIFLPDIIRYMPFAAARTAVDTGGGGGFGGGADPNALAPDTALLLVAAWLVGALLVAVLYTERAEITG